MMPPMMSPPTGTRKMSPKSMPQKPPMAAPALVAPVLVTISTLPSSFFLTTAAPAVCMIRSFSSWPTVASALLAVSTSS